LGKPSIGDDELKSGVAGRKRCRLQLKGGKMVEGSDECGQELVSADPLTFRTFTNISYWTDEEQTQRVSLVVNLPSGVSSKSFRVEVVDEGLAVDVSVLIPQAHLDMVRLHRKPLENGMRRNDPIIQGFETHLSTMRRRKTDELRSTMRVRIAIQAQKKPDSVR
jgi:hypothetical protein